VGIFVICHLSLGTPGDDEISVGSYQTIEQWCEDTPELTELIQSELEDGKISYNEYKEIKKKHTSLEGKEIVKRLRK
jgi:hypothetical protein